MTDNRSTFYMKPQHKAWLADRAEELGMSMSQLLAMLIEHAAEEWGKNKLSLEELKLTRSHRKMDS